MLLVDRPLNMVSPMELNLPGIEDDFPDDMTPRPLDEPFESTNMPPPPMIQIAPLALNSIWDSDMMTKYTNNVTGKEVALRPLLT